MDRNQSGHRKKFKKLNNRGLTLVELLVTIAILGVVGGTVILFLHSGTRSYQSTSEETDMQYEAQVLLNQLEGYVIGANLGLSKELNKEGYPTVYIMNKDEKGVSYERLTWNSDNQRLYYERRKEANGLETIEAEETILAENVAQFSMDVSKAQTEGKVEAQVELVKDDKSYEANAVWNLRNKVLSGKEAESIYELTKVYGTSSVRSVEVFASRKVLIPGEEQSFYAKVNGSSRSAKVVWSIEEGATSPGTYIEENGMLHTGEDEEAKTLTITAQSVEKPSVRGSLSIQMDSGGIEITPGESWIGVTGGSADPHSYGNNRVKLQARVEEDEKVDLSTFSWECDRESLQESLQSQDDPLNKTIEISSTEPGGDIIIQAFAEKADGGTIRSNQVVIHVVELAPYRNRIGTNNDGFAINIKDGLKDLKEGDIQYASSFRDIMYNRKNCRFYVYDAKELLRFWRLKRDINGGWTFYVYCDLNSAKGNQIFKDPLEAYAAPGLYEAGKLEKKTDIAGDSHYYGFSVSELTVVPK